MENNEIIIDLKNQCEERIKGLQEEIRQNEMLAKCCDDATKSIANPSVIKKIKYNASNARNAAENPDVAPADDKERAEKAIEEASVQLMGSKNNLEVILQNLNQVVSASLINEVSSLTNNINANKDLCEKWIGYSKDVLNGNYYEMNEQEEVVTDTVEEAEIIEPEEEQVQTYEEVTPVVEENPVEQQVVSVEPFEKKEETDFDKLTEELDAELDKALKPVQEDIANIQTELTENNDITPIEPQPIDSIDNITEPADLFSLDQNEPSAEVAPVAEETMSAANVDEGAVKVVKIEEVGAPEKTDSEEYTRRLAA